MLHRILPALLLAVACAAPLRAQAPDVFELVTGTWSWFHGDTTCTVVHRISFSDDRSRMFIEYDAPADSAEQQTLFAYDVVRAGPGIHPGLSYVIRAKLDGETRTTDKGAPVVWDLILASRNRYHWHRTDWGQLGITGAVVRCAGDVPLETWSPPAAEPDERPRS